MSELKHGLQVGRPAEGEILETAASIHGEKLQTQGRNLVSALYMMIRSVQLYDPANAVFLRPLDAACETINLILAAEGKLDLQVVKDVVYLNGALVRMDMGSIDNVRYLCDELRKRDVGGFAVERPVTVAELRNFLAIFDPAQRREPGENGLNGNRLVSLRLSRYVALREKIQGEALTGELKIDQKKYALTVYARAVVFLRRYFQAQKAGQPLRQSQIHRVVQDLTDIVTRHRTRFLRITAAQGEGEYLVYHSVNTAISTLVFGQQLGLDRTQLRELAATAMFHDAGMCALPEGLLEKPGALTPAERAEVKKAPVRSVELILSEMGLSRTALVRAVATHEHKLEFGAAIRDARGGIERVVPGERITLMAQILGLACVFDALTSTRPFRHAYPPELALTLMGTELRHKFDPELLFAFRRVMTVSPVRAVPQDVLSEEPGT